jgi:hypothetical protein
MYEADSDMEGYPEQEYVEMEASPAQSISSDDDTNSIQDSDSEFDSELDHDVDPCMEDEVDTPDSVDLDGDVDMERVSDDEVEKDEQEEVEEEEDEDDDDGKEPRTIGLGEIINKSADDVDTMVDDQPIVLPEQGQEMCKHILWTQLLAHAPQPQTPELRP